MNRHHTTPLDPADEALELRDIGAADLSPTQAADAYPPDDTDDPEFVAAMNQREAARDIGYVDALCLGCGCLLYVPVEQRCRDVLCTSCRRTGEALAAEEDGDDEPTPPATAEPVPSRDTPEYFAYAAGRLDDDQLVSAIHLADTGELFPRDTAAVRTAALSAFASELLRRIDAKAA